MRVEGFRISASASGSGFRVQGSGFRVQGSGSRAENSGFRAQGPGLRIRADLMATYTPPTYLRANDIFGLLPLLVYYSRPRVE